MLRDLRTIVTANWYETTWFVIGIVLLLAFAVGFAALDFGAR